MSSFIVDARLIATLANQVTTNRRNGTGFVWIDFHDHERHAVGLATRLATENIRSVCARYTEEESKHDVWLENVKGLTKEMPNSYPDVSAIQWLKTIHCLEYQSCDHEPYDSMLYQTLLSEFIPNLDGYEEAVWGLPYADFDKEWQALAVKSKDKFSIWDKLKEFLHAIFNQSTL